MSSVADKSSIMNEKRNFFIRSSSFEKLKCSAKYPFRVVVVKLSQSSVIELAETIIARSRHISQRMLLVFVVIYKAIYAALSILVRNTTKSNVSAVDVCDEQNKNTTILGFYERLQIKAKILQEHKNRLEAIRKSKLSVAKTEEEIPKIESNSLPINKQNVTKILDESNNLENNNDEIVCDQKCDFRAELRRLREISVTPEREIISDTNTSQYNKYLLRNSNTTILELLCLYPLVYGSILIMLCQFYVLGVIINSSPITFGFVFLIGSLGFIAYITFKVFFIENFRQVNKCATTKRKVHELKLTEDHSIVIANQNADGSSIEETSSLSASSKITLKRQSRSRLKRDLSSKTLSKIKLL